jgi:hypothetical protein
MFFSPLKIPIPLSRVTFRALIFHSFFPILFLLLFSLSLSAPSLYFRILKIVEEKTNFNFFFGRDQSDYTMNMKMGSCRYIGGGHIRRNGLMHANIFRWG